MKRAKIVMSRTANDRRRAIVKKQKHLQQLGRSLHCVDMKRGGGGGAIYRIWH